MSAVVHTANRLLYLSCGQALGRQVAIAFAIVFGMESRVSMLTLLGGLIELVTEGDITLTMPTTTKTEQHSGSGLLVPVAIALTRSSEVE